MKAALCWNHGLCDRTKCRAQHIDEPPPPNFQLNNSIERVEVKGRGVGVYSPTTKKPGMRRSSRNIEGHRTDTMTEYVDSIKKRSKAPPTKVK